MAAALTSRFPVRGTRVAVQLPDGGDTHVLYLAAERAGIVVVGIGPRAGAWRWSTSSAAPTPRPC